MRGHTDHLMSGVEQEEEEEIIAFGGFRLALYPDGVKRFEQSVWDDGREVGWEPVPVEHIGDLLNGVADVLSLHAD